MAACETCVNYIYDEEDESYYCDCPMDEDDMYCPDILIQVSAITRCGKAPDVKERWFNAAKNLYRKRYSRGCQASPFIISETEY